MTPKVTGRSSGLALTDDVRLGIICVYLCIITEALTQYELPSGHIHLFGVLGQAHEFDAA